jgi:hypothetical protein
VNVVGNYIKYNKARYPVFLGKLAYRSKRTSVLNNTLTGSTDINYRGSIGGGNLWVHTGKGKFIVQGNLLVYLDSPDGSGIIMRGVKNCLVSKNKFKNVRLGGIESFGSGAIYGRDSQGTFFTEGCKITDNDYSESGLPGWTTDNPGGSGCVLLDEGSEGNYVAEKSFPKGAGDKAICYQIKDLTMTSENPRGDNKIKDWRDDCIASD